jgi:protein-tyrosine-phosphatase
MKILFVCRANIGRSQVAEALFRHMVPTAHVFSAGTKVVSKDGISRHGTLLKETPGAEKVLSVLEEIGIDHSKSLRTQLEEGMLADVDRIIVMAEPENIPSYLSSHPKFVYWEVPDLKGTDIEFHRKMRDYIKNLIENNPDLFTK